MLNIKSAWNWLLVKLRLRAATVEHSVEDAISHLNTSLNNLKVVQEAKAAEAVIHDEAVKLSTELATKAKEEAARAGRIYENITALIA